MRLKAPFPWFGGKRRVAEQVWQGPVDVTVDDVQVGVAQPDRPGRDPDLVRPDGRRLQLLDRDRCPHLADHCCLHAAPPLPGPSNGPP